MRPTVYLDETGSFRSRDSSERHYKPWIVAGLITRLPDQEFELVAKSALSRLVSELDHEKWFQEFESFVSSELEKYEGFGRFDKRRTLYNLGRQIVSLRDRPSCLHGRSFLVWGNLYEDDTGRSIEHDVADLRERVLSVIDEPGLEARKHMVINEVAPSDYHSVNYALTLQESVVALLSENSRNEELNLPRFVIAYRTEEDEVGPFDDDLDRQRLLESQFANAVACGLASAGRSPSVGLPKKTIKVLRQEVSCGLALADFVCSEARNVWNARPTGISQSRLKRHLASKGYSAHWVGQSVHKRRIQVSLDYADIPGAVFYAIQGLPETHDDMERLVSELLKFSTYDEMKHNIEGLLGRIDTWARTENESMVLTSLQRFMDSFFQGLKRLPPNHQKSTVVTGVLFRLSSYLLVWANHVGNDEVARNLEGALGKMRAHLSENPAWTNAVQLFDVGRVERAINGLNFGRAVTLAKEHLVSVIAECEAAPKPESLALPFISRSHAEMRAHCLYLRAVAHSLAGEGDAAGLQELLKVCYETIGSLSDSLRNGDDRVRLLWIAALLVEHSEDDSTSTTLTDKVLSEISAGTQSRYLDAVLVRSTATASLVFGISPSERLILPVEDVIARLSSADKSCPTAHPDEIVLREAIILRSCLGAPEQDLTCLVSRLDSWSHELDVRCEIHRHQLELWQLVRSATTNSDPRAWDAVLKARRRTMY